MGIKIVYLICTCINCRVCIGYYFIKQYDHEQCYGNSVFIIFICFVGWLIST